MIQHPKKKKTSEQSIKNHRNKIPKSDRLQVQNIFPIKVDKDSLTPQMSQYVTHLQRQYLQLYNIMINNRSKYDQMFSNFAALMDQKGIRSEQVTKMLQKVSIKQLQK